MYCLPHCSSHLAFKERWFLSKRGLYKLKNALPDALPYTAFNSHYKLTIGYAKPSFAKWSFQSLLILLIQSDPNRKRPAK